LGFIILWIETTKRNYKSASVPPPELVYPYPQPPSETTKRNYKLEEHPFYFELKKLKTEAYRNN